MNDDEVFDLALAWIKKCTCVGKKQHAWYPTRLIGLSALKLQGSLDRDRWEDYGSSSSDDTLDTTVKVVETSGINWAEVKDYHYVTLSHRWGNIKKPVKLTTLKKGEFEKGLKLKFLPKIFQDAILLATRLHRVGYIWIDSMCIIQDDANDWLQESALMHKVYRESFLNISATAAENGDKGLYCHRDPQFLWENEINLNIQGLQGRNSQRSGQQSGAQYPDTVSNVVKRVASSGICTKDTQDVTIKRCLLMDISIWESLVNQAPINRRGWVVQERLLSPRILHFCRGRIAWECTEFEDIEGNVPGMPNVQLIGDELHDGVPTKGLDPLLHGGQIRRKRLCGKQKHRDLLSTSVTAEDYRVVCALEIWARAVELYSRTDLTQGGDKLIALSGIASQMARTIGSEIQPAEYVAGLWKVRLVDQLLWKIEPAFLGSGQEAGGFEYPSTRSTEYRAPSFSWASVDAQYGSGITYGECLGPEDLVVVETPQEADTDPRLARDVDKSVWMKTATENPYGLVKGGHLLLWGWIRRAKIRRDGAFFSWYLQGRDQPNKNNVNDREPIVRINAEQHLNVYMDCPGDDNKNDRLIQSETVYCLPVALGPPTAAPESKDLICLLLEQVPEEDQVESRGWHSDYRGAFRRIGLTKLTRSFDSVTMSNILQKLDGDQYIVPEKHSEGYDEMGRHLIRLI